MTWLQVQYVLLIRTESRLQRTTGIDEPIEDLRSEELPVYLTCEGVMYEGW